MKLHKYKDYNQYVQIQIKGNKANANGQWCKEDETKFLSEYLINKLFDLQAAFTQKTCAYCPTRV